MSKCNLITKKDNKRKDTFIDTIEAGIVALSMSDTDSYLHVLRPTYDLQATIFKKIKGKIVIAGLYNASPDINVYLLTMPFDLPIFDTERMNKYEFVQNQIKKLDEVIRNRLTNRSLISVT